MLISLVLQCLLATANPVQEACKVLERTFGQVPAKVEFRSGSLNIGSVEVDEDLSQGSFKVPFPGPGTNEGLQREVAVYLTLTGGPDSYGMVSLY